METLLTFIQNFITALQLGSIYAIIAIGYSMVYGVLMLFNFAHGDILMVGSYIGFGIGTLILGICSIYSVPMPYWLIFTLTLLFAMLLTSFVGVLIERIGYRPLRNAPRASAAITGLMIGIILETTNLSMVGAEVIKFPDLIESMALFETIKIQLLSGSISITAKQVLITIICIGLCVGMHLFIMKTKWGMAMRAMSYDFVVVPLMGVPMNFIAGLTFAIGSALAAAAGIFFTITYPPMDSNMGIVIGWKAFIAAILGGRGSIIGATFAGFLLAFIELFVIMVLPSAWKDVIAYSIILFILVFKPHGFFGEEHSAKLRL